MNYKVEDIKPYDNNKSKKEQVIEMFDEIAPRYDQLNGALSLGIDKYWRKEALRSIRKYQPKQVLDIATGTGDFAILAQKMLAPDRVTATDISKGMMEVGARKVLDEGLSNSIEFECQDCSSLSYYDNTFDAAISAFGVRNFEDINNCFKEVSRVLKPGGIFMFIELSTPEQPTMEKLYNTYTKYVMPTISRLLATEQRAYEYLPESISAFPQGREMMLILQEQGFVNIRLRRLTMGVAMIYFAEKAI